MMRRRRIAALVFLVIMVTGIWSLVLGITTGKYEDCYADGVLVDGISLKGYTRRQAEVLLEGNAKGKLDAIDITLRCGDKTWQIGAEEVGARYQFDKFLDEAWQFGHTGNVFQRYKQIRQLKKEPWSVRSSLEYDDVALDRLLRQIKSEVDIPAKDAWIEFDSSSDSNFAIGSESTGVELLYDDLLHQVTEAVESGRSGEIQLAPVTVQPKVFADDLQNYTYRRSYVTTQLGESSDARIHNVRLAASFFNGMRVDPGQTVSFNEVTGPRGLEEGYQNAGVILDDEVVDGPGGGVCQVSTTLYQALVKADIQIDNRRKHSLPVSYVDVGTDAAVSYGGKDLVFTNNTDGPIFLAVRVSNGKVRASVYGAAMEDGLEIRIENDVYEKIPAPEPQIIADNAAEFVTYTDETYTQKTSKKGYKVAVYRVYYKDGAEISREKLSDDYYKEVTGVVYVGVTERPEGSAGAGGTTGE